ncbi:MAG: CPBP family intramembrane metalloprotease [Acidobacteriia bacterium]|nr:CPBP family intramembrane metalloprotease [Terriglobia bacterium]
MSIIVRAVLIGLVITFVGSIPRSALFLANLRLFPQFPWAVPVTALYLLFFWRYLNGSGPPDTNSKERKHNLRANPVSVRVWFWSLVTGGLAIVALVLGLRLANRFMALPPQGIPDLGQASKVTIVGLLLIAAPAAAIIEESAFRGYMQGPIERHFGLLRAILITGTMFALAHLDFTPILWPYYVAVAAIYCIITHIAESILPAIVLHTAGNLYSNFDLYLHGQAEWQAPALQAASIWVTGLDTSFWFSVATLVGVTGFVALAYSALRNAAAR